MRKKSNYTRSLGREWVDEMYRYLEITPGEDEINPETLINK